MFGEELNWKRWEITARKGQGEGTDREGSEMDLTRPRRGHKCIM